ncbi:MAG: glycoside hydrolase family 20 zincin-like fold domain-containing protein, partial [Chitinophagales bacterium]
MIRKLLLYAIALTILLASCTGNEKKNLPNDALSSLSSLIPVVKKSSLSGKSFSFSGEWRIDVVSDSVVYNSLKDGLQGLIVSGRISLNEKAGSAIRFILKPGSVDVDQGIDTNKTSLEEQAYQLQLAPKEITITANAAQGLYYGVQTFLQLIQSQKGDISLPEGEIRDWPDLSLRMIYWDDAHHLEKFGALKRIILQASHYKINAFALKLEGHFQYSSAPAIIEPYALSPQQYQELTDFARAHFVELVPYLDAPAHISFILKHPEYSGIRLYPNNNYELSVIDPGSVTLMKNMFGDLLDANKGGECVML